MFTDLTGMQFGRLKVISLAENKGERRQWLCVCTCGNYKKVITNYLNSGQTSSCGCLVKDVLVKRVFKHGAKKDAIKLKAYRSWTGLRDRCNNVNNQFYNIYGGRGITYCERWNDFNNFFEDMGSPPIDGKRYSLDRIDVNGNYETLNCRWATDDTQANNRTNTRYLIDDGDKITIRDFCKKYLLDYTLICSRLGEGVTDINELKEERKDNFKVTANGISLSIKEWCEKLNILPHSLYSMKSRGKSYEECVIYFSTNKKMNKFSDEDIKQMKYFRLIKKMPIIDVANKFGTSTGYVSSACTDYHARKVELTEQDIERFDVTFAIK